MNRESFLNQSLGFWSSHPRHVTKRARWMTLVALMPLALLGTALFVIVRNPSHWLSVSQSASIWLAVGVALLVFSVAFFTTISVMTRLNRWRHTAKHIDLENPAQINDRPRVQMDLWLLVPSLLLAFVGPYFALRTLSGNDLGSWFFRMLAFLPLLSLLAVIGVGGEIQEDRNTTPQRRTSLWILSLSFAALTCFFAIADATRVFGLTGMAASLSRYVPVTGNVAPWSSTILFALLSISTYVAWRQWLTNSTSLERKARGALDSHRLGALLGELFRNEPKSEDATSNMDVASSIDIESIPESLRPIVRSYCDLDSGISDQPAGTAAFGLSWFLDHPTSETANASFASVITTCEAVSTGVSGSENRNRNDHYFVVEPADQAPDLTAALMIQQALFAGKRSLWLIADQSAIPASAERLEKVLRTLALDSFLDIASIDEDLVRRSYMNQECCLPMLLLATPDQWESIVWKNTSIDAQTRTLVASSVDMIGFIDPCSFPSQPKKQLTRLIRGHRILQATIGLGIQVVATIDIQDEVATQQWMQSTQEQSSELPSELPVSLTDLLFAR